MPDKIFDLKAHEKGILDKIRGKPQGSTILAKLKEMAKRGQPQKPPQGVR